MPLVAPQRSGLPPPLRRASVSGRPAAKIAAATAYTPANAAAPATGSSALLIIGLALGALLCGAVIAVAGLNALYLCAALIGCVFIMRDFRVGVVLLILLIPISRSAVFPHAMLGITG